MVTISLGPCPSNETPIQLGSENYYQRAKIECSVWINQLKRTFNIPEGLILKIKGNPHDFGTYYEVEGTATTNDAIEMLFKIEQFLPSQWDIEAKEQFALLDPRNLENNK